MSVYDNIELSEDELREAILEAKKKKFFHEKNKEYWEGQEVKKYGVPKARNPLPPPPLVIRDEKELMK